MSCSKGKKHKVIRAFHRVFCPHCGKAAAVETCADPRPQFPEPAGWRALMCGYFTHRPAASPKRLWDQLRLSLAYQPWGDEFQTQPDPPRWFMETWIKEEPESSSG